MKFPLCVLAILSPVLAWANLAGDWAGVIAADSQAPRRIVVHITGPDSALRGTADSPDQRRYGVPVESIILAGATVEFSVPATGAQYSGVLKGSAIVGTLTQGGVEASLVLGRISKDPLAAGLPAESLYSLQNGRYHDNLSGVEFDLPDGWFVTRTDRDTPNPGGDRVFTDPSGKAMVMTAFMLKTDTPAESISKALAGVIPHQIAMRAGVTGQGPLHMQPNYKIRDGSIEQTYIGGHPAIRAIGEYQRGGKSFAELLAWIYTEHTRTYFMLRATAENLPDLQAPFDEMLQSAKVP
ncbi:MAG TPA: hypothetical protein VME17_24165 [Bryobacteraceae bacterium]|nr:hypothetical protein [Bryobacteraceae bacterium]